LIEFLNENNINIMAAPKVRNLKFHTNDVLNDNDDEYVYDDDDIVDLANDIDNEISNSNDINKDIDDKVIDNTVFDNSISIAPVPPPVEEKTDYGDVPNEPEGR
jgi:hypothetical protein